MPKVNINSLDFDSEDQKPKKSGRTQPKKMKTKEEELKKKPKK
jgi:hypothetical protein